MVIINKQIIKEDIINSILIGDDNKKIKLGKTRIINDEYNLSTIELEKNIII